MGQKSNINAEIVAIGTELLLGEITDTNSVYLAQQFRKLGINLYFMTTVGDNERRIADAIRLALSRADVVITCGGLGPTVDDMTRQAVAQATERDLIFSQTLYNMIAARFATYNVKMSENNRRQAYIPESAHIIENPVGTAPCFAVEHENKFVISLPGVPREMKFLFENAVTEFLHERYDLGVIASRTLKTAGIGESSLDELLGEALLNQANPSVGLAAHHGIIDIRMTAKASDEESAQTLLDACQQVVMEKAGRFIFGQDDSQLEDVYRQIAEDNGIKLVLIEAGNAHRLSEQVDQKVIDDTYHYQNPDEISCEVEKNHDLRQLAACLVTKHMQEGQQVIVILSQPDVDEHADNLESTVVSVGLGEMNRTRGYGFGAKSALASDWVNRWALSIAWQQIKAQYDVE